MSIYDEIISLSCSFVHGYMTLNFIESVKGSLNCKPYPQSLEDTTSPISKAIRHISNQSVSILLISTKWLLFNLPIKVLFYIISIHSFFNISYIVNKSRKQRKYVSVILQFIKITLEIPFYNEMNCYRGTCKIGMLK